MIIAIIYKSEGNILIFNSNKYHIIRLNLTEVVLLLWLQKM